MVTAIGIFVLVVGLIAWLGQSLSFLAPPLAVKLAYVFGGIWALSSLATIVLASNHLSG